MPYCPFGWTLSLGGLIPKAPSTNQTVVSLAWPVPTQGLCGVASSWMWSFSSINCQVWLMGPTKHIKTKTPQSFGKFQGFNGYIPAVRKKTRLFFGPGQISYCISCSYLWKPPPLHTLSPPHQHTQSLSPDNRASSFKRKMEASDGNPLTFPPTNL